MDDCKKILTEATSKSLCILDELGRGTSTFDGVAIAFSVLHHLATHKSCIGFFSTHYNSLVDDFQHHSNVRACHMSTMETEDNDITFLYKLANGPTPSSYGPIVARKAGVNSLITERAAIISEQFQRETKERERTTRGDEMHLCSQEDIAWLSKGAQFHKAFLIDELIVR